jgi:hypothetical protein
MVAQVLFGLAFMVIPGVVVVSNMRLKRRGHRTTGTVAAVERDWNPDPKTPGYTYWPVLEFQTDRGQDVRTRAKVGGSPQVGRRVRILYDPDNPQTAEIDTIWGRGTIVFGAFALIGIYLIVSAILSSRLPRTEPGQPCNPAGPKVGPALGMQQRILVGVPSQGLGWLNGSSRT